MSAGLSYSSSQIEVMTYSAYITIWLVKIRFNLDSGSLFAFD